MTDYPELERQLTALIRGVPHFIANLSNASALLFAALEDINWAGFYHMEQGRLVLGPFQGKPAEQRGMRRGSVQRGDRAGGKCP